MAYVDLTQSEMRRKALQGPDPIETLTSSIGSNLVSGFKTGYEMRRNALKDEAAVQQKNTEFALRKEQLGQEAKKEKNADTLRNIQEGNLDLVGPAFPGYEPTSNQFVENDRIYNTVSPDEKQRRAVERAAAGARAKAQVENTPSADGRKELNALSAEGKKMVGSVATGIQSLKGMEDAIKRGIGPEFVSSNTPVIGEAVPDTDWTRNERQLNEMVGRLQSGGAIQKDEVKTFRALGPSPADYAAGNMDIISSKFKQQSDYLSNKLAAFGLKGEQLPGLGFKTDLIQSGNSGGYAPKGGTPPPSRPGFKTQGQVGPPLGAKTKRTFDDGTVHWLDANGNEIKQ